LRACVAVAATAGAILALSCSGDAPATLPPQPGQPTKLAGITWYKHVQPIVNAQCVSCHTTGGLAPFPLTTYDQAKQYAPVMSSAVVAKTMPPWMPDPACQHYAGERLLTQDQINQVYSWNQDGAPLGDPADQQAAPPPPVGLANPSQTLDFGQTYTPTGSDDYHCFMLDPALTQAQDLIAYEFVPGQRQEVHHTLIYSAARTDVMTADAAAPGLGWPCGGGSNVKGALLVATWVPGSPAIAYPAGTGISIPAANVLIAQMHYNLA
jgi:hypothetical protein